MPKITIKAARINAGMTLKQASAKLGISYQTLSRYENSDQPKLKLELINKMAEVYGIAREFIFLPDDFASMRKGEKR